MDIIRKLTDIIKPLVEAKGYYFVDLKYGKNSRQWYLQVIVDKIGGFTIGDCKAISKDLNYELDRYSDLLKHAYRLEVSSPGIDRPLKTENDFKRNIEKDVRLELINSIHGVRKIKGTILKTDNGNILLDSAGQELVVPLDNIIKGKLEVKL